jgi:repressor LexA
MYDDLNQKQIDVLNYVKKEVLRKGYPPAIREIVAAVGLKSTSTVHSYLTQLEKKGYIRRDPLKNRAIEIVDDRTDDFPVHRIIHVPIVGEVAAGSPILAVENIEDTYPLPVSNAACVKLIGMSKCRFRPCRRKMSCGSTWNTM